MRLVTWFMAACVAVASLSAQTSTSQINGTLRDASGAVVPGALVVVTNEETGVAFRQNTTEAGAYAFPAIPVGRYTVSGEAKGFKTSKTTNNIVVVNTPLTVDLVLAVGETSEVVSVEARGEAIQTQNASIGNVVERKAIVNLPLNGRNPLALLVLEPGVVQRSAGAAGSGVHVNGSRDRAFNVTIDGIEANESTVPNPMSNLYRLTPDNVQEYKVTTSNATAEEGRNSGASISVATRQGTNQVHGTLFEFFRNSALNSNEFFNNAQKIARPDLKMNQYGFEVSGPIVKNKTFFFFSWADQKINFTQPIDQTFGAPTLYSPAARSGQYRYWVAAPDPASRLVIDGTRIDRNSPLLVDTFTGALRADKGVRNCASPTDVNCVASYNFAANDPRRIGVDPTIGKLFSSYPLPNNYGIGDGLNTATYLWNPPTQVRGPNFMARVDHNFNENHSLFFRALWGNYNTLQGDPLNGRPQVFPGFPPLGEVYRTTKNFAASYRWVVSPRVVNEFTAGLSRFVFLFTQGEANPAFPDVPAYSFNNASLPYINTPRTFRAVTTPQFLDNLSIIRGSHVFKMGFNIRMYEHNDQRGQPGGVNVTPSISFSSSVRPPSGFNTPALAATGRAGIDSNDNTRLLGAINDVMGIPARLSQVFLGDVNNNTFLPFRTGDTVTLWAQGQRLKQYNFYFQDEWRIRRNITINYGLRWEINPAPTEAGGRVYVPDKSILGNEGLVTFVKADRWFQNNNLGALGPRLGVTWAPNNKTVLRAGYGIAFDPLSSFQVTAVAGRVPGQTFNCSSTLGGATTTGCQVAPDIRIAEGFPSEMTAPTVKPQSQLTTPVQVLSNSPGLTVFDQNWKLPTVHQWNFNIQRELPMGILVQGAYIGRRGLRLSRAYDVNQINADPLLDSFAVMQRNVNIGCNPDGTGCTGGVTPPIVAQGIATSAFVNSSATRTDLSQNGAGNFVGRLEQTTVAGRYRPNQQFGTITYLDSGGNSYYHGAQFTLRKRFEGGLLLGAAYTFAKSMDDQSVDPVGSSSGGGLSTTNSRTPTDVRNWRNERGRSDFDRTHVFTANGVYDLPFGKGKRWASGGPGWVNTVIGGWSLNSIVTAMSGEPFSVRSGVRTANFSHESRADLAPGAKMPEAQLTQLPNVIGPSVFTSSNPADLGFVFPQPGSNGIGRNTFEAPGYFNMDIGIVKRINFTERVYMQFRAEFFNALNHPNFDNPRDATVGSPSIRSNLFGQTCCATVAPPSTQSIIQTGESARIIQFGLKVAF